MHLPFLRSCLWLLCPPWSSIGSLRILSVEKVSILSTCLAWFLQFLRRWAHSWRRVLYSDESEVLYARHFLRWQHCRIHLSFARCSIGHWHRVDQYSDQKYDTTVNQEEYLFIVQNISTVIFFVWEANNTLPLDRKSTRLENSKVSMTFFPRTISMKQLVQRLIAECWWFLFTCK